MRKIMISLLASLVAVSILFFCLRYLLLKDLRISKDNELLSLERLKSELETAEIKLTKMEAGKLPKTIGVASSSMGELLVAGRESELMKFITDAANECRLNLDTFDLMNSFFLEDAEQDEIETPPVIDPNQMQLDENGMPLWASIQDDSEERKIEMVPVKVHFKSTFRRLGKFFQRLDQGLPLFSLRAMELEFDESGIVSGDLLLVFPVREAKINEKASRRNDGIFQE